VKELYIAFALLLFGFVALGIRATRDPFDYKKELLVDGRKDSSLSNAFEKILDEQNHTIAQPKRGQ